MFEYGNAAEAGVEHRNWFLGHFVPEGRLSHSSSVEIKWSHHPVGDRSDQYKAKDATSISILVRGKVRYWFVEPDRDREDAFEILLNREGDYVMWGPGMFHAWEVEEDALIITVRWPSNNHKEVT